MKLSDHLHMPPVGTLMTPFPHTIAAETPVSEVEARMKSEDFRHLPVVEEGSIGGIVSIRDLNRRVRGHRRVSRVKRVRLRHRPERCGLRWLQRELSLFSTGRSTAGCGLAHRTASENALRGGQHRSRDRSGTRPRQAADSGP